MIMSKEQVVVLEAAFVNEVLHVLKNALDEKLAQLLEVQNRDATEDEKKEVGLQAQLISITGFCLALEVERQMPGFEEDVNNWSDTMKEGQEEFSKRAQGQ